MEMTLMSSSTVRSITALDARFSLPEGAGSDAVHTSPVYAMALTHLKTEDGPTGVGLALALGDGNRLVCEAIRALAPPLIGQPIEEVMATFGDFARGMSNDPALRWLGPQKGVVHLALASISNACWDLWAKSRGLPLWKLLLDLEDEALVAALDLSYLEDVLSCEEALALLRKERPTRKARESILRTGYPGYDTSVGWMAYDDMKVRELTLNAMDHGFRAFKLKVGSTDEDRDARRAAMLRELAGDSGILMFDANQRWNAPEARRKCLALTSFRPLWIEEPTHPDDIQAHVEIARAIAPVHIAAGEHIPNRIMFKSYFLCGGVHFVQADCTRLAGVGEFLAVSLMAKKFQLPVVPHVGDMGQIHQHLVLFNHVALNHEMFFLEHIPHLREHFVFPAQVIGGVYKPPQEPGASTDMRLAGEGR
jgi:L-fuconate dehydratase